MHFVELIIIAVGVSMDAFAVSVCKGLSASRLRPKYMLSAAVWFGGFQALMPLLGYFIGISFADFVSDIDHWIAFALLTIIGGKMIKEACQKDDDNEHTPDFSFKTMLLLAVATSIDAMAVGISLAMTGGVNIWLAVTLIGTVTFLLSGVGVKIGSMFGARFEKKAQIFGGVMLILLGLKILLEHLGVL